MADNLRLEAEVVDRFSKPLADLQKRLGDVKTPRGTKDLTSDFQKLEVGAKRVAVTLGDNVKAALSGIGLGSLSASAGIAALAAGMKALSSDTAELARLSKETKISLDTFRSFQDIGKKIGMSADEAKAGIVTFSQNMRDIARGAGTAYDTLMAAPVSVRAFTEHLQKFAKDGRVQEGMVWAVEEIAKEYKSNPRNAQIIAEALFANVNFSRLPDAIQEAMKKSLDVIGRFTADEIEKMKALDLAIHNLGSSWDGLVKSFSVEAAPGATKFIDAITTSMNNLNAALDAYAKHGIKEGIAEFLKREMGEEDDSTVMRLLRPDSPAFNSEKLKGARSQLGRIDEMLSGGGLMVDRNRPALLKQRSEVEAEIKRLEEAVAKGVEKGMEKANGPGKINFSGDGETARIMRVAFGGQPGVMPGAFGGAVGGGGGPALGFPNLRGNLREGGSIGAFGGGGGRSVAPGALPNLGTGSSSGRRFRINPDTASELAAGIRKSASDLGVDEKALAAIVSYETAGTMNPMKAGPTTRWGQHRGLIQWGQPQSRDPKFWGAGGSLDSSTVSQQMEAVTKYMQRAGVKPGMGLLDMYSAVNAGGVGRYGMSDGYGTVASHTANIARFHGGALAGLDARSGSTTAERSPIGWPADWARKRAVGGAVLGPPGPAGRGSLDITLHGFPKKVSTSSDAASLFREVRVDRGPSRGMEA